MSSPSDRGVERVEAVAQAPWQPISTAPKDGTEVLAWREDCGQFIASWTHPAAMPMTQAEIDECEEDWLFQDDWFTQWPQALRLDGSEAPTMWMNLPPNPKSQLPEPRKAASGSVLNAPTDDQSHE